MKIDNIVKKCFILGIIVLFIGSSTVTAIALEKQANPDPPYGSLSGYVYDTLMQPLNEVRVRVYFHGTFEEDYTDGTGYYFVDNIPICYCLKDAEAYKEGYKTETVTMSIGGDEILDFVLWLLGDANGDCVVNVEDLLIVLFQWGTAGPEGDLNDDGIVNTDDLLILLAHWG